MHSCLGYSVPGRPASTPAGCTVGGACAPAARCGQHLCARLASQTDCAAAAGAAAADGRPLAPNCQGHRLHVQVGGNEVKFEPTLCAGGERHEVEEAGRDASGDRGVPAGALQAAVSFKSRNASRAERAPALTRCRLRRLCANSKLPQQVGADQQRPQLGAGLAALHRARGAWGAGGWEIPRFGFSVSKGGLWEVGEWGWGLGSSRLNPG